MKKVVLILSIIFIFLACDNSQNGKAENSLILNLGGEPDSIDPQLTTGISGGTVDDLIMEGLLRKNKEGESVAGIAKTWSVSPDGLKWTFNLRDAKWSNGDPITANDFRAGWIRALDPKTAAENAGVLFMIKNGEEFNSGKVKEEEVGIKVIDEKTLEVELDTPTAYFDDLVTFKAYMPLNEKFYKEQGDKYFTKPEYTLSSGPYLLKSWKHDSELIFEKNPTYWDASNVKVENITLKLITDSKAALSSFKNGELDVVGLTVEQLAKFKNDSKLVKAPDGGMWYLLFNTNIPSLKNTKIRKALVMGLNRDELVNSVLDGGEIYRDTFVPEGIGMKGISKDFYEEVPTKQPSFNPEEAKKLLAEGLKESRLTKLPTFEIIFGDSGNTKVIAEYIQESLRKNLGVEVILRGITGKERIQKTKQRDYEIAINNWTGDFRDPITYLDLFESSNASNRGDFKNSRYDELVKIVKNTADPAIRVPAMIEMEKIISEETPVGILFKKKKKYLLSPKVKGLGFVSIGGEFNFKDLVIEK